MAYLPCVSCRRHVVAGDVGCPFCGATLTALAQAPRVVGRRSRGALFSMGASLVLAGCSGSESTTQDTGPDYGDVSTDAAYGAPYDALLDTALDTTVDTAPVDAAGDATDAGDASDAPDAADSGFAGAYGGPPPDGG